MNVNMIDDIDDFNEVKISTKFCAFVKHSSTGDYLHFSTKNSSIQGEFPGQKVEISESLSEKVQSIIENYPKYCNISELGIKKGDDEYRKLYELGS
jgi:hypothetical protein